MKSVKLWLSGVLVSWVIVCFPSIAAAEGYGAAGAQNEVDKVLTLESMLSYALEDEYLARGEYQEVIRTFGGQKPFTNIIKAEERHISWLEPLFERYGFVLPVDRGMESAVMPASYAETFPVGVAAEVANIEMSERFLKQDLPSDVRDVFVRLHDASENHLAAFQKWQNKF